MAPPLTIENIRSIIREHLTVFAKIAHQGAAGAEQFAAAFSREIINHPEAVTSIVREAYGWPQTRAAALGIVGLPLAITALLSTVNNTDHTQLFALLQAELSRYVQVSGGVVQ